MITVLVTGCAGFIGHGVTKILLHKGYKVVGIDNLNQYYDKNLKQKRLNDLKNDKFIFYKKDICDRNLDKIFIKYKIKIVVNLAAQAGVRYSLKNPYAYFDSNLQGFGNILELSRKFKIKHLVYASSSSVYGLNKKVPFSEKDKVDSPSQVYAATKRANELMAFSYSNLYKLPTTGIRFFTIYGPWGRPDMSIFLFTKKIVSGEKIDLFDKGNNRRDFTFIDDASNLLLKCIFSPSKKKIPYEVYNLGRGKNYKIIDMIKILERNLNLKAKIKYSKHKKEDLKFTEADNTKISKKFKYTNFTKLEKGIKLFVNWFKQNY
jgi:UDP-glucuronate 4-epimerase